MAKGFGPKPLVDVNLVSDFGGIEDTDEFKNRGPAQRDYMYVPGFSDMQIARQEALARLHRHEIKANEVPILPVNCRWFRTTKGAGNDPDRMRVVHATNSGYRAVTKEDLGEGAELGKKHAWLTALPPGAQIAADGTIKTAAGDMVLMVASREQAAKNALRKKILTEQQIDGMEFEPQGLMAVGSKVKGANPTVEKRIGDHR